MRKALYILAAVSVLILASSCEKEVTESALSPITFSPEAASKALVNDLATIQGAGVDVWGFEKDYKNQQSMNFNDVPLSYSDSKWSYTGASIYWTPRSNYHFFGTYPQSAAWAADANAKTLTLSGFTTAYSKTDQTDLLAGCAYRAFTTRTDGSTVVLPMQHILSKLEFKVRNSSADNDVTVTNVVLTGIKSSGDCTLTPVDAESKFNAAWTAGSGTMTCNGDVTIENIAQSATTYKMFDEAILVIPQAVTSDDIIISFHVASTNGSGDKSLKLNKATAIKLWEAGKKYTYIVSVTDTYITFDLEVLDWEEDEPVDLNNPIK